ncbi:MAG: NAD(P)-dependent oxidoreductase [Dehalococcoidia bacterium]|nr:NAD(P)-dependent oxidoreductase [Dehalococcoidia bacterium]
MDDGAVCVLQRAVVLRVQGEVHVAALGCLAAPEPKDSGRRGGMLSCQLQQVEDVRGLPRAGEDENHVSRIQPLAGEALCEDVLIAKVVADGGQVRVAIVEADCFNSTLSEMDACMGGVGGAAAVARQIHCTSLLPPSTQEGGQGINALWANLAKDLLELVTVGLPEAFGGAFAGTIRSVYRICHYASITRCYCTGEGTTVTTRRKSRRILVTGGTGYVGTALVPLLAREFPVVVFCQMNFGNAIAGTPSVTFIDGDIRDASALAKAMEGCTDIVHLAGIVTDELVDMNPRHGRPGEHRRADGAVQGG